MLARRLVTILPAMSLAEALETTRIHGVAGLTSRRIAVVTARPFWGPHHPIAEVGMIGGTSGPCRGRSRWRIIASWCWMSWLYASAMSGKSSASHLTMDLLQSLVRRYLLRLCSVQP